jgi:hypothetical protein
MDLRGRLERLERETEGELTTLLCSECGQEFTCCGDVAVEYMVHEWARGTGEQGYRETPEDMLPIFDHEHDASAIVEKSSGLPFLSREVSGINLGGSPKAIEDLSQP